MTDQQIVTGPGDIAEDNAVLGLNIYGYLHGLHAQVSNPNLGQGPGALAWLTGDFLGLGNAQIAQPWDANGGLGLNIYGNDGGVMQTLSISTGLGQGSGALAWLTGDFAGLGRPQILQPWDANGTLGLNVYAGNTNGTVQTVFTSSDLGQGPGALAWLTGDFLGWGSAQIAQLWDNNGTLGLNLYAYIQAAGVVAAVQSTQDMGEGSGALAWLTGDFLGTGRPQIAQPWDNNGAVGLLVYGDGDGAGIQKVANFPDTGQGSGALAWVTGDFTGQGRTEIAQPWNNNGTLGLNVYGRDADDSGWNVEAYADLGQGPDAVAWLTGDFLNLDMAQIAQPWDNHGALGLLVYGGVDSSPHTVFDSADMDQGSGALAWLTGDFLGFGYPQIAQPWASLG